MAPTQQIESITVVRPLKVMAMICGIVGILLLTIATASTYWLEADGYRQGLWEVCKNNPITGDFECSSNEMKPWITACAALSIVTLVVSLVAVILNGVGLQSADPKTKYKFYRVAMYVMFVAIVCLVVSLMLFPIMFMQEIDVWSTENQIDKWYFSWAYGLAWGGCIFLIGAAILLLVDKESEEIFYREKTFYPPESSA